MAGATALRLSVLAVLLPLLVGLIPMAYASPPDQTWLPGIYDDGDHDDVVLALTSTAAVSNGALVVPAGPKIDVVDIVASQESSRPADALRVPYHLRAPPLA